MIRNKFVEPIHDEVVIPTVKWCIGYEDSQTFASAYHWMIHGRIWDIVAVRPKLTIEQAAKIVNDEVLIWSYIVQSVVPRVTAISLSTSNSLTSWSVSSSVLDMVWFGLQRETVKRLKLDEKVQFFTNVLHGFTYLRNQLEEINTETIDGHLILVPIQLPGYPNLTPWKSLLSQEVLAEMPEKWRSTTSVSSGLSKVLRKGFEKRLSSVREMFADHTIIDYSINLRSQPIEFYSDLGQIHQSRQTIQSERLAFRGAGKLQKSKKLSSTHSRQLGIAQLINTLKRKPVSSISTGIEHEPKREVIDLSGASESHYTMIVPETKPKQPHPSITVSGRDSGTELEPPNHIRDPSESVPKRYRSTDMKEPILDSLREKRPRLETSIRPPSSPAQQQPKQYRHLRVPNSDAAGQPLQEDYYVPLLDIHHEQGHPSSPLHQAPSPDRSLYTHGVDAQGTDQAEVGSASALRDHSMDTYSTLRSAFDNDADFNQWVLEQLLA